MEYIASRGYPHREKKTEEVKWQRLQSFPELHYRPLEPPIGVRRLVSRSESDFPANTDPRPLPGGGGEFKGG